MQVIKVGVNPVNHVVNTFWGTHLKNVATHDALYCPYPRATVEKKQMVVLEITRGRELCAYQKYLDRGFERVSREELSSSEEFQDGRSLDDRWTLVVPYDQGVGVGQVLSNFVDKVGWKMKAKRGDGRMCRSDR